MVLKETPTDYIVTKKSNDDSLFAVIVRGDSMAPEINEGDMVVVSKLREAKNGDTCVIVFEDDHSCLRRIYHHDHHITLTSANEKEYPPTNHKKSEIKFIYRVVQRITNY